MIHGGICSACRGAGRCVDKPTEREPLRQECAACGGRASGDSGGCQSCGGLGYTLFTDCPQKCLDRSTFDFLRLCHLSKRGALPVAGGTLDQTQWFIDGYSLYLSEDAYWRNRNGAFPDGD